MATTGTQRRFRGKTAQERQQERRARLIDAGLLRFGTDGFHGVGVRELCHSARLTERYFYESFPNRVALFRAVYDHCVVRVRTAMDHAIATGPDDPAKLARAGLEAFFAALQDEPCMARVLLIDVLTVDADTVHRSQEVMLSFVELVGTAVVRQLPHVEAAGLLPHVLAQGLLGATVQIAMQWVFGGFAEPRATIVEHAALIFEAVAMPPR